METLAADASLEVEQLQLKIMCLMPTCRNLQLAGEMNRMVHTSALRGLRQRYPRASDTEPLRSVLCLPHRSIVVYVLGTSDDPSAIT